MNSRYSYTVEETRDGILHDMKINTRQLTMLNKALMLLDSPEHIEVVREWFDVYMSVVDEQSFMEYGRKLDELESKIMAI